MAKLIMMYILFLIILCHGILQISPAIYKHLIALEALPPRALVSASDRYSNFQEALFQALFTTGQRYIANCFDQRRLRWTTCKMMVNGPKQCCLKIAIAVTIAQPSAADQCLSAADQRSINSKVCR